MRIAVCIGHNEKSQGAVGSDGVTEWVWNGTLAPLVSAPDVECAVFVRKPGLSYRDEMRDLCARVNEWKPDVAIELHFNASVEHKAHGTCVLHWPNSHAGEAIARRMSAAIAEACQMRNIGAVAQDKSWAGATLYFLCWTNAPAVIVESHFGDNETDRKIANAHKQDIANAILRSITHADS